MTDQPQWQAMNFDALPSVRSAPAGTDEIHRARFDGDTSELPDKACWALQNLLKSRYLRKATDPELWAWTMRYRPGIESRLSELNLRLKVVDGVDVAFTEPVTDPSRWARRVVRRETLGTYDAILALQLTKLMRVSHDEDAVISRSDLHDLFGGVSHDTNTDRAKFENRINGAIAKLVGTGLLNRAGDDDDGFTISPVITAVMTATLVTELEQKFTRLKADKLAGGGYAEDDGAVEEEEEEVDADAAP